MKSCNSVGRAVCMKIKKKAESVDKGKKNLQIIDKDRFTKVVNTQRTSSTSPDLSLKTPILEPRVVKLV